MLPKLTFSGVFLVNLLAVMTILTTSQVSRANEVYVRDTLYVPLRSGQSTEHRILHRGIKSGTPLERLETNEETGYTRVRTDDGLEGWLQTQYLVDEPIASTQLDNVKSELVSLGAEHQQTLASLRETKAEKEALIREQESLAAQNPGLFEDLKSTITLSANAIAIDEQNKQLGEDRDVPLQEIRNLNELTEALSDDRAQAWFLRGAGTLLVGLLFGFWLGRQIYNQRSTSDWT
ncbi:MAG: TIGR04211 family SH3 domain-containing protein [Candidatus Azotimanducaceae bacterium WSBS_2022_MAG_OTU7]